MVVILGIKACLYFTIESCFANLSWCQSYGLWLLLLSLRKNLDARTYTIMVKELKKYSVGDLSDSDNNADNLNTIPTVQN